MPPPTTDAHYQQAMERLRGLYSEAQARDIAEPCAASLATTSLRGQPSIRMVTVVDIDTDGPVFFADANSGKGRQLGENPCAALCFFWPQLNQQVVIEGHADPAPASVSDHYWAARPRAMQLAAWAGTAKARREDALAELRAQFDARAIPRPVNWRAMYLYPDAFLFWKLGWHNPHDRERFLRDEEEHWYVERQAAL